MSNNYYLKAVDVCGANGADITAHSGAVRGYVFDDVPLGIGDESSEYALPGILFFDNGLKYGDKYVMGYICLYDAGFDSETETTNSKILQRWKDTPISIKIVGRTLYRDGTWNTICLPFALNNFVGTIFEGASVMFFDGSDFDPSTGELSLVFDKGQDGIAAGLPYFVKWDEGGQDVIDPIFSNVTIDGEYGMTPTPLETTYADVIGTFDNLTFSEERKDILYLGEGNNLFYPSPKDGEPVTIGAFRGYFKLKNDLTAGNPINQNSIRAFKLVFEGEETAITSIIADESLSPVDESWYTLDGRRLSGKPTTSGLYISNGRKVIIK